MAIIQYSGLVNEIRGKLNGSVLNKSRTVNTIGGKNVPSLSITTEQSVTRARFQRIQTAWKLLSVGQQAEWSLLAENVPNRNRFGEEVVLSGYNKYMEATLNADVLGSSISYPLNTNPLSPPLFDDLTEPVLKLMSDIDGNRWMTIGFQVVNTAGGRKDFVCDVSKPISRGVTTFSGSFRFMGSSTVVGSVSNVLISSRYFPGSWVYRDGDRVAVRVYSLLNGRGLVNYERIWLLDIGIVPQITSFSSIPSTGAQPYVYSVSFANKGLIDGIVYRFEFRSGTIVGACPLSPLTSAYNIGASADLLANESLVSTANVPIGSCRTIEVRIVRIATGEIVSLLNTHINNI